jgi:iron(II)-dependent oxidoreductase
VLTRRVEKLYDAFEHPRAVRTRLPLLPPREARSFISDVRGRVLDALERTDEQDLFRYVMVEQHEQQHAETMLATHQLRAGPPLLGVGAALPRPRPVPHDSVLVPAGVFQLGVDGEDEPWSLDNERPAHVVDLPAFRIGRAPVTNAEWQAFIDAGGYDEPTWWSAQGWAFRQKADLSAPLFWRREADTWWRVQFGIHERVVPSEPVVHVSFYEAQAYAAWAGRRLPTEAEWEKAARWDPATGRSRAYPWGDEAPGPQHANLGQRHLRPAEAGAYPLGASPLGVQQLIGDVWEWTSSDFHGYPGFTAFPYPEYSLVFFGSDYKVLRGGSFGSDAVAVRGTFRNWDYPIRRQIFAGFRCARDAVPGEVG